MNRYHKRLIAALTAVIVACTTGFTGRACASPLDALNIFAGEALAIRGTSISGNDLTVEALTVSTDGGSTSENTVVFIESAADMINLANNADIDSYTKGKTFILTKDIDLMGYKFTNIPVFAGVFDGKYHSIRGVTYQGNGYVTGLFRYIDQGAVVQNLTVYGNIEAVNDEEITGGICGINEGIISKCRYRGVVKGKNITGGIAAINEVPGTIMACVNDGAISGYYYTGGITGKNYGVTAYSINNGAINNTTEWVEGSDAMEPKKDIAEMIFGGSIKNEDDVNIRITSGVDTGGIAGYSRGAIYECNNKAEVGYEHTGYNVGGIVGRQAGFVSFCINEGTVYGRKDIGGIVGQMEPYLTLSDLESLPEAVDKLHDLVDESLDDMDASAGTISDDVKQLSVYADDAVTSGDELGTSARNYLNSVSDAANSLQARVDYLSDKVPGIIEHLSEANEELGDTVDDLKKMINDADVAKKIAASPEKSASVNEAKKVIASENSTLKQRIEAGETIVAYVVPEAMDAASTVSGNVRKVHKDAKEMTDKLEDTMDYSHDVVDHINSMSKPVAPYLGSDFDDARTSLADNLSGMSHILSILADHSDSSSKVVTEDLSRVNDQMNVVYHIISDQLDRIGNFAQGNHDEIITDVSEEEIDNIEQGRVDHSNNKGNVEGDINIGGIAGSMSIDTDDPEENAAGSMDGGFDAKYLLRNIVLECRNDSNVKSKKDGSGGIVGYMEQGIVKGCQSYGYVQSSEGGYVGGIAGQSNSIVKDSCAMGFIEGGSFLGGITGYGTTVNDCTAFPAFESSGTKQGAIAGHIETDSETHLKHLEAVSGNRFVNNNVAGIDGVSAMGKAEPISYEELVADPAIPNEFRKVLVVFRVDDTNVGESRVEYGSRLSDAEFPDIPPADGMYVSWDNVNKNISILEPVVVTGELKMIEKTLKSNELYPGTEANAGLVSGNFIGSDKLSVTVTEGDLQSDYEVSFTSDHSYGVDALRLYNPFSKAVLYGISDDGEEHKLDAEPKGSYIEVKGDIAYPKYRIKNDSLLDKIRSHLPVK